MNTFLKFFSIFFIAISFSTNATEVKFSYAEVFKFPEPKSFMMIHYFLEGVPEDIPLRMSLLKIDRSLRSSPLDLYVGESHRLGIGKSGSFQGSLGDISPGEPFLFMVISKDHKIRKSLKIVPFPIEDLGAHGESLSVEYATGDGFLFNIFLKGFQPYEKLKGIHISDLEYLKIPLEMNAKGEYQLVMAPALRGKKKGCASFTVERETNETLSVYYQWGRPIKKDD